MTDLADWRPVRHTVVRSREISLRGWESYAGKSLQPFSHAVRHPVITVIKEKELLAPVNYDEVSADILRLAADIGSKTEDSSAVLIHGVLSCD